MTPRARQLFDDWHAAQGQGIKAARPLHVFSQCVALARSRCSNAGQDVRRVILKAEDITACEQRALSSARLAKFGPPPSDPDVWQDQMNQVRAEIYAAREPARQAAE